MFDAAVVLDELLMVQPKVSTTVDSRRHHLLFAVSALLLLATLIAVFRFESINVSGLDLFAFAGECILPILIVACYCQWAGYTKLREGCFLVAWGCLFMDILPWPQYAAARVGLSCRDKLLVSIDHLLAIDVGSVVAWSRMHPAVATVGQHVYSWVFPLVGVALLAPPLFGQLQRSREFIYAAIVSSVIGAGVLALVPAIGPWAGEGFVPYPNQLVYVHELTALRHSGPFIADLGHSCGLITFPSFHVTLAVLSVYALWGFRRFRILTVVICISICVATMTTGWHYAADVIGGVLLAWAAILISRRVLQAVAAPVTGRAVVRRSSTAGLPSSETEFPACA